MTDTIAERTKLALRRLAKSVAVITTRWEGARLAMAATAVEGLSLDPPSMLLCVNKTASIAAALSAGAPFAINLLATRHAHLVQRCSAPWQGEERFAEAEWGDGAGEVPILRDAEASFLCRPDLVTPYGSHLIVVGLVAAVETHADQASMVFAHGAVHRLSPIGA